jgi:16S rRNA (uracil1498-N3)-methyltransferase
VALAVALLKGKTFDRMVRMVTEVGVSSILPFTCERSVPRPDTERLHRRIQRWRTIAAEAVRQSGRSWVPTVETCTALEEIIQTSSAPVRAVLHEASWSHTLPEFLETKGETERILLVGPEGGFSEREVELATRHGFEVVGLGLPILRAETAAVAAAVFACVAKRSEAARQSRLDRKPSVE